MPPPGVLYPIFLEPALLPMTSILLKRPPFVDDIFCVAPFHMKKSSSKKLIGIAYMNHISSQSHNTLWDYRLTQHITHDTFPFHEFVELCSRYYQLAYSSITTIDGQTSL